MSARAAPSRAGRHCRPACAASRRAVTAVAAASLDEMVLATKKERLAHLESQALAALDFAAETGGATFPCALIAGDVVILDLLAKRGYIQSGKVRVAFIDTFHLFPETVEFMAQKEAEYGFEALRFKAVGCDTKDDYDRVYGADLWKENIEEYDRVAKVEPFQRALKDTGCTAMINGRRRDHGFERAFLDVYEGKEGDWKVQPLAYWTFEDCFDYLRLNGVPYHPLHDQGYPSIGDAKDTVTVPKEKWFEYAGERSGRFQGLNNQDGSRKTECGIHVDGAERTFERDLWEAGASEVMQLEDREGLEGRINAGEGTALVVYAPWCQFCQAAEGAWEQFAAESELPVAKYRGDTDRDFVRPMGVESFPTFLWLPKDGGKPVKYTGGEEDRTPEKFAEFFNAQA